MFKKLALIFLCYCSSLHCSKAHQQELKIKNLLKDQDVITLISSQLTPEFCQSYVEAKKDDQSIQYEAGVTVRGEPVVSADLNAFNPVLSEHLDLHVILPRKGNRTIQNRNQEHTYPFIDDVPLGVIRYDFKSGTLLFNGKPLGQRSSYDLYTQCKKILSLTKFSDSKDTALKK